VQDHIRPHHIPDILSFTYEAMVDMSSAKQAWFDITDMQSSVLLIARAASLNKVSNDLVLDAIHELVEYGVVEFHGGAPAVRFVVPVDSFLD